MCFRPRSARLPLLLVLLWSLPATVYATTAAAPLSTPPSAAAVAQAPISLPFVANGGQLDAAVAYYADTFGGRLFVTQNGELVYALAAADGQRRATLALHERFIAARPAQVQGGSRSTAQISQFGPGNHDPGATAALDTYTEVSLGEIYPGIQIEVAARGRNIEKLFQLQAGADPALIHIALDGAQRLEVAGNGQLRAHTELGAVDFTAPVAWQQINGQRVPVAVSYRLADDDEQIPSYGFELGSYDRSQPLLIDPLLAATNLGGPDGSATNESINSLILADGALYVAGTAFASDFPTTAGVIFPTRPTGSLPGFVARLSLDLSTLEAATYLGGKVSDPKIELRSGSIYFAATAGDASFPTTSGSFDTSFNGGGIGDIAIARISLDLTQLQGGTYLGSVTNDVFFDLATYSGVTDSMVCVVGYTDSSGYPTTAGAFDTTHNGSNDAVISCLSLGLSQLKGSTYFGGSTNGFERAMGLAMMPDGVLFRGIAVAGTTTSGGLPAMTGLQTTPRGDYESFIITFTDSSLSTISAGTYLGGSDKDLVEDIAYSQSLDAIFVAGRTRSLSGLGKYPVSISAFQLTGSAEWDIFATRLPRNLSTLSASTFFGGNGIDEVSGMILSNDALVVLGLTTSSDLPTTPQRAYAEAPIGVVSTDPAVYEAFILQLSPGLSAMQYGSYYGVYQTSISQGATSRENRPQDEVSVFDSVPALGLARESSSGEIYFPFLNANATLQGFQSNLNNPGIVRMNLLGAVADLQLAPAFVVVSEGDGQVTLTTSRIGDLSGYSRAILARQPGGAAQAGEDFLAPALPSIRSWQPGSTTMEQTIIDIIDDDVQEAPNESAFFGYNADLLGANLASSSFASQIVIQDDDQAGIEVDTALLTPSEGETVPLGIRLTSSPPPGSESVNVRISSSDTSVATIEGADGLGIRTLSFSASNWNQFQFAQIVADDNALIDGNRSFQIQFLSVLHSDPFINGITHPLIAGSVVDNDTAGIDSRFSPTQITSEADAGAPAEVAQIRLTSQPSATVSVLISLGPQAAGEGALNTAVVQFNASNWNLYQIIQVNPLDDTVADGDRMYPVRRALNSADANYQMPAPVDFVQVTNLDDEMADVDLSTLLDSGQPQGFIMPNQTITALMPVTNGGAVAVENIALALDADNGLIDIWSCMPASGSTAATTCMTPAGTGAFVGLMVNIGAGQSVLVEFGLQATGPLGSILGVMGSVNPPPGVADSNMSNNVDAFTLVIANSAAIFADGFE